MTPPGLNPYLAVAAALFALGMFTVMTRRNTVGILLGLELMLNAAALNFVAFDKFGHFDLDGQVFALFIVIFAACEAAVALAAVLQVYAHFRTIAADEVSELRN